MSKLVANCLGRIGCVVLVWGYSSLFLLAVTARVTGEDFYLTEGSAFPGHLLHGRQGEQEQLIHRRAALPDPAFPNAVMKLAQVAVGPDNKLYYCSGLDGSVMHLLDGRHEIQIFEFPGQVRDVACSTEEHTVYFSVVSTPQDGQPLADGKIYRRNLWDGQPVEIAAIRQADVGHAWWGLFTLRDGVIYLATHGAPSRLYQLVNNQPTPVFPDNAASIQGLATGANGVFYFTTGSGEVFRTSDFLQVERLLHTSRGLTDVALRPE